MEGLTSEQLEHFKDKLIQKRAEIEGQLQAFAKKSDEIKGDYETVFEDIGRSEEENADEVANYTDRLGMEHDLEDNLVRINEALTRLEKGTYGQCANCDKPIPLARLEAMPEATICIDCE